MIENALYCMKESAEVTVCEECSKYYKCDHSLTKHYAEMAVDALEKQIPKKVIKTDICSQACPECHSPVNNKYCSFCGQALKY